DDADQVAEIEQAVRLEALVAEPVAPRVDLETAATILDVQKAGLPEVAQADDASRDGDVAGAGERGFVEPAEPGVHFGRGVVGTEVVRVGRDPPLPKRLELLPPDHGLLVVFGHAAGIWRDGPCLLASPQPVKSSATQDISGRETDARVCR